MDNNNYGKLKMKRNNEALSCTEKHWHAQAACTDDYNKLL